MNRFLQSRIPLYWALIICAIIAGAAFVAIKADKNIEQDAPVATSAAPALTESFSERRLGGFNYIRPLMFVETGAKAERYSTLLQQVSDYINRKKANSEIDEASFYFQDVERAQWTGFNETIQYNPGSLMKVPELISVLRLEEEKPGTLNKQLYYAAPYVTQKRTRFVSEDMPPGKNYTVKELLRRMISYSDNNATVLLDANLDQRIFNETLTDLGLPLPAKDAVNYPVNAKDYSLFMRAIVNAAYLTIPHSEYAAELLSTSHFKEGFVRGFPEGTKIIHKFGEAGTMENPELHESCIVYVNNKPYVLTVMTRGKNMTALSQVLSDVAGMVYRAANSEQ